MSTRPDRPNLEEEQTEAGVVARLVGCNFLDEQSIHVVSQQVLGLADELGAAALLLDLGGVHYLTSTALGMLVTLHTRMRDAGGQLTLLGVNDDAYEVLHTTRLTRLLDVRRQNPSGPGET
jgi:anti-anti-sigma factor